MHFQWSLKEIGALEVFSASAVRFSIVEEAWETCRLLSHDQSGRVRHLTIMMERFLADHDSQKVAWGTALARQVAEAENIGSLQGLEGVQQWCHRHDATVKHAIKVPEPQVLAIFPLLDLVAKRHRNHSAYCEILVDLRDDLRLAVILE